MIEYYFNKVRNIYEMYQLKFLFFIHIVIPSQWMKLIVLNNQFEELLIYIIQNI